MIILQRKKILLCMGLIVASMFAIGTYKEFISKDTIPTVSLPVSNKVIVLDAGHGKPDEGD